MRVAIVVPTFNRRAITSKYVDAISADSYAPKEIIICDSGSTDGTRDAVSGRAGVVVHDVGSSAWWSAAVNVGVRDALARGFDYLVVANDDIVVPSDLLSQLMRIAASRPHTILSAAQRMRGQPFLGQKLVGRTRRPVLATPDPSGLTPIDLINGCFLVIPRAVFDDIGVFNERACPHLAGDVEFLLRARRAGTDIVVANDIVIGAMEPTDLRKRYCARTLLTAPFSPYLPKMHLAVARQLYGSLARSVLFGAAFHLTYILGVAKGYWIALARNRCI